MKQATAAGTITLVSRLAKLVHRRTSDELLGMSLRQYVVLSYLADHEGVPQQDLGDAFCMDPNNLVLLLNELEAATFVARRRDPEDRRRHIVELTATGRESLERAQEAQEAVEDSVLRALDAGERAALRRLLAKALEG